MRPGLRRIAGSPTGQYGAWDSAATYATFNNPLDIVLSADQKLLYIADYGNQTIRVLDLYTEIVTTLAYLPYCRPKHLSLSPDGTLLLVTGDDPYSGGSALLEVTTEGGTTTYTTTDALGAIAHHSDGQTAIVRVRTDYSDTGWMSLALTGPDQGTLTEPPILPDPPFCDPPTNSIPVTVVYARDGDMAGDAGVAYVGSIVVAYQSVYQTSGAGALAAFDPWGSATPTFPGPYVTCGSADDPPATVIPFTDETAPMIIPRQLAKGPTEAGLPTLLGALWQSSQGVVQRIRVDTTNPDNPFTVDFDASLGLASRPLTGMAYSSTQNRLFFSTAGGFANVNLPGEVNGTPYNQIVELTMVSDPPIFFGGSAVMPIGKRIVPEEPVSIVDEDGNVLVDENGDTLIFG